MPIVAALRAHLAAHLLRERRRDGLILGRTATEPFDPRTLAIRAGKAWTAAKLAPIGLHELRHSCASIFIAAGVNAKALSTYLGHSSITVTLDRYGHLMPGSEDEAVASSTPTWSGRLAQKLAHPARRRLRSAVCSSS